MNFIILSVDGLHNGMIGAFGNAWIQTPTLNSLALDSVLFDRYYTDSMELPSIFRSLWQSGNESVPSRFNDQGFETLLLTDDDDIFLHEISGDFSQRHRLESFQGKTPVESLEETQFFKVLATTVDLARRQTKSKNSRPYFLWTHLRGFRGPWDFSPDYREKHRDEEDPEAYCGVQPPKIVCQNADEEIHPDDLQAVMEAYTGGVAAMDDALAGLIESLEEDELGEQTVFVLLSTRGFSLGEHRQIGADEQLYGENIQLPLIIRFPNGFAKTVHCPALLQPKDLADFFSNFPSDFEKTDSKFFKLLREELDSIQDFLLIENDQNEKAIVEKDWFLRRKKDKNICQYELYVKPDDHWESNDVTDRCSEQIETLSKLLD